MTDVELIKRRVALAVVHGRLAAEADEIAAEAMALRERIEKYQRDSDAHNGEATVLIKEIAGESLPFIGTQLAKRSGS